MTMNINDWLTAFVNPHAIMKKYRGKTTWDQGLARVLFAGVLAGLILGFFKMLVATNVVSLGIAIAEWMSAIITAPITLVVIWILMSLWLYISARLLGGKAGFSEHANDLTWYIAPLALIESILVWIPLIGGWLGILIWLWSLYPLTIILEETHKFSAGNAVLTWLVWVILELIVVGLVATTMITLTSLGLLGVLAKYAVGHLSLGTLI